MLDKKHLMILQEIMDELTDTMDINRDDLEERLGRKPKIEMISIKSKMPIKKMGMGMDMEEMDEEMDMIPPLRDGKYEMEEECEMEEEDGEDEKLKKRIMSLRG